MAIILASQSPIRQQMLRNAGVEFHSISARIDEDSVKLSLIAEGANARDVADALAEAKARKVSFKHSESFVLGSDQVLEFKGEILGKPKTKDHLITTLQEMRGQTHSLLSAAVIYQNGEPVWRFVGQVRLLMAELSDEFIADYTHRNWESVKHSAGGYMIESEGSRLFTRITGDYFTILGLPLLETLSFLRLRGEIAS